MKDAFKPGDLVQLKSGGPGMTVTRIVENGAVLHTWWFAGKKNETAAFPIEAVIPFKDEQKKWVRPAEAGLDPASAVNPIDSSSNAGVIGLHMSGR